METIAEDSSYEDDGGRSSDENEVKIIGAQLLHYYLVTLKSCEVIYTNLFILIKDNLIN